MSTINAKLHVIDENGNRYDMHQTTSISDVDGLQTALNAKANVSDVTSGLAGKVDKESGKGLSTNDFTTAEKNKLSGIEAEANKTTVDSALSSSSTNPLQNKVINTALGTKQDTLSAAQLAAVNSGIDSSKVAQINTNQTNISSLQEASWVTPQSYGAKGDGTTDDTNALQSCIDSETRIYIPSGKYKVTSDIKVGSNKYIRGDGKSSEIYYSEVESETGEVINICGDNVIIDGINPTYINSDRAFLRNQPNMGSIGVTNIRKTGGYENRKNVVIRNIYSDVSYIVQTENTNGYTIENVTYNNIIAPNSVVSMCSSENDGIRNCNISNVVCGVLRTGWGYSATINVDNVHCNKVRSSSPKVIINNLDVNFTSTCKAYRDETWDECVEIQGVKLSNATINGNNTEKSTYGLKAEMVASSVVNCTVKGFTTRNLYSEDGIGNSFCNCDFDSTATNTVCGRYTGCVLGQTIYGTPEYFSTVKRSAALQLPTGWTDFTSKFPRKVDVSDGIVHVQFCAENTSEMEMLTDTFTLPTYARPYEDRVALVITRHPTNRSEQHVIMRISPSGLCTLDFSLNDTIADFRQLICDFIFEI